MDARSNKCLILHWFNLFVSVGLLMVVLSGILVACGGESSQPLSTATPAGQTSTSAPSPPTATPPPPTTATDPLNLTPQEAQTWCSPMSGGTGRCDVSRFEQLVETSNGAVNPHGVHMKTGDPVSFNVPAGILVDVWDCFKSSRVSGPIKLPQVCEAVFRRVSA